jgi:hypothetical protein
MKKSLIILLIPGLFTLSCARILDQLWNPSAAEFNIEATQSGNDIVISIPKTDHLTNIRTTDETDESDSYFWGYYVYRNSTSPYENFHLIGISAQEVLSGDLHFKFIEKQGSSTIQDPDPNESEYRDVGICPLGSTETFYYRVVVVYREYSEADGSDPEQWENSLEDKSASSWAAVTCNS